MTEKELLDELYAAEEAVRSPEHQNEMALMTEAMQRAEALQDSTRARTDRRDAAIAAWKAHLLDKTGDVNVHEAVAAIADAPPETADNSGEDEDFGWQVAEAPKAEVLPSIDDLTDDEQDAVVAVLDDAEPFECVRPIIGRASDVTDEQLAEAQAQDRREQDRREAEKQVRGGYYNPDGSVTLY